MISLWDFAGNLYQQLDVQEQCLRLQDENGVDVSVLLAMPWYGYYGERVEASKLLRLLDNTRRWREEVVLPIRQLRTALATHKMAFEWVAPGDIEATYNRLKQLELQAERTTLNSIEKHFAPQSQKVCPIEEQLDCIGHNLECYLSRFTALSSAGTKAVVSLLTHSMIAMQETRSNESNRV